MDTLTTNTPRDPQIVRKAKLLQLAKDRGQLQSFAKYHRHALTEVLAQLQRVEHDMEVLKVQYQAEDHLRASTDGRLKAVRGKGMRYTKSSPNYTRNKPVSIPATIQALMDKTGFSLEDILSAVKAAKA